MNIFVLDEDPKIAAQYHCDKHCIKMIVETAQILCSAHWINGSSAPYKLTHSNHPCSLWARACIENYNWLCNLGLELCKEYTYRYNKIHKTQAIIEWLINNKPSLSTIGRTTKHSLAMPDSCKKDDVVSSYRNYYNIEKRLIATWKNRPVPEWFIKPA